MAVAEVPGPPHPEASWFQGYSWKVLYMKGCGDDAHIGWSYYQNDGSLKKPAFVFVILHSVNTDDPKTRFHALLLGHDPSAETGTGTSTGANNVNDNDGGGGGMNGKKSNYSITSIQAY